MLKVDLHIHSIHSGHAYGTFYDIVNEAVRKKMKLIAITDHGPSMVGTTEHIHFKMGDRAPKTMKGVRILWGCEANIIDRNGNIDLEEETQNCLDIILVAFHRNCGYENRGKEKNTEVMKRALKNPRVKILTHPANQQYDCDLDEICNSAIDNNVLLELNLVYLKKADENDLKKFKKIIEIVKSRGKKIIVGSDAHFIHEIGDDSVLKKYWDKLGLTKEIIINNHPNELMDFLGLKNEK